MSHDNDNVTPIPGQEPESSKPESCADRVEKILGSAEFDLDHYLRKGGTNPPVENVLEDIHVLTTVLHDSITGESEGDPLAPWVLGQYVFLLQRQVQIAQALQRHGQDKREAALSDAGVDEGPNPAPALDYLGQAVEEMRAKGCDENQIAGVLHARDVLKSTNSAKLEYMRIAQEALSQTA